MKKAKLIKKDDRAAPQPKRQAKKAPQRGGPAIDPRVKFAALFGDADKTQGGT